MKELMFEFGVFYFMFWWVMSIFYKDNAIHRMLEDIGIWIGQRTFVGGFVCSLGECKFCIESHTATLIAIGYYLYTGDIKVLIWGFLCASINSWLRTFLR